MPSISFKKAYFGTENSVYSLVSLNDDQIYRNYDYGIHIYLTN